MVSCEEMKKCEGKRVRLTFYDSPPIEEKCLYYYQAESEYEEPFLELEKYIVDQSKIKSIEILD